MNIEFKASRKRCYKVGCIFFLMALLSGIVLVNRLTNARDNLEIVFCGFICLFSIYWGLKYFRIGYLKKTLLSMNEQGITDNFTDYGFIHFSEIINIELTTHKNNKMIDISVYNMDTILQRMTKFNRIYKKINYLYLPIYIKIPVLIFQDEPKSIVNQLRSALNTYQHQIKDKEQA